MKKKHQGSYFFVPARFTGWQSCQFQWKFGRWRGLCVSGSLSLGILSFEWSWSKSDWWHAYPGSILRFASHRSLSSQLAPWFGWWRWRKRQCQRFLIILISLTSSETLSHVQSGSHSWTRGGTEGFWPSLKAQRYYRRRLGSLKNDYCVLLCFRTSLLRPTWGCLYFYTVTLSSYHWKVMRLQLYTRDDCWLV